MLCVRCNERERTSRNSYCAECWKAYQAEWRRLHPKERKETYTKYNHKKIESGEAQEYREEHRDQRNAYQREYLKIPERREYQRNYEQTPQRKEYLRKYHAEKKVKRNENSQGAD